MKIEANSIEIRNSLTLGIERKKMGIEIMNKWKDSVST